MARKSRVKERDGLDAYNALTARLTGLEEQSLVLAASAFAEHSLTRLLTAFMLPNKAADLLISSYNAPLGTLSSKIKIAYALGLVTEQQFDDLENMRNVRNDFSHTWEVVSFSDQSIADRVRNMSYCRLSEDYPESTSDKFRTSVTSLLLEIEINASQVKKLRKGASLIATGLIAGFGGTFDDQIKEARAKQEQLNKEISSSEGEKQKFLLMIERRLISRLAFTWSNAPADRKSEVAVLIAELESITNAR